MEILEQSLTGATPIVSTYHYLGCIMLITTVEHMMDDFSGTEAFTHLLFGPVMTRIKLDTLTNF